MHPPEKYGYLEREREREREIEREIKSLTYLTNTSNVDSFSLIFYSYRKIPEPGPDRFYRLFPLVDYPFCYPFSASRLLFPQEYNVVIENKIFSGFAPLCSPYRTPLGHVSSRMVGGSFLHIWLCPLSLGSRRPSMHTRASTERAVPSWQTPETSPALPLRLCVMPTFERSVNSPQEDFPLRK